MSWLKNALSTISMVFTAFFGALFRSIIKSGGNMLLIAADEAVKRQDSLISSNDEKRKGAYSEIESKLIAAGFSAAGYAINAAIEAAVAKLREEQGKA